MEITNVPRSIDFNIPADNLSAAFIALRKEDPKIKHGGYSWHARIVLNAYDNLRFHKILYGSKSLREVFNKIGFNTGVDDHGSLCLVGYHDLVEFGMVARTLRMVAPYADPESFIEWVNSEGDSWTEIFKGGERTITNEITAEDL